MVESTKIKECLKDLLGFTPHYNSEVPELTESLKKSDSGQYYNELHPALKLNIIAQSLERGRVLNDYLEEMRGRAIIKLSNDLTQKKLEEGVKDLIVNDAILDKLGFFNDKILGQSRFVGFMFAPRTEQGLSIKISDLGIQLNGPAQFNFYVYHSSQEQPLAIIPFEATNAKGWNWIKTDAIDFTEDRGNGLYYIGYYQSDLASNAINYTDFDWGIGHCNTCDGGVMRKVWNKVRNHVIFSPFYVPLQNLDMVDRKMFEPGAVMIDNTKSYGMNFKTVVNCDLTDFYCLNKLHLVKALGSVFTYLVLQDIKFSMEKNHINSDMKNLIIRDLEGDKETHLENVVWQMKSAIKNVYLDTGGLAKPCLPCTERGGIEIGVA